MHPRGLSQAFYKRELWREMGYSSLEDFLVGNWEGFFLKVCRNNVSKYVCVSIDVCM